MRTLRPSLEKSIELIKANTLKEFILEPHSGIADDKAIELSEALKNNTSLVVFSLSSIEVSDTAAQSIAQGLANHPTLDKLILVGKKISVQGIYLFIDILPTLKKLTWLTLIKTTIGDEGIKRLGQILPNCSIIRNLALEDNQITDEGAHYFIEYIKPMQRFIYIDLGSNKLTKTGLALVKQAMLNNLALMIRVSCNMLVEIEYERHVNSYADLNVKLKGSIKRAAVKILGATRFMHGQGIDDENLSLTRLPAVIKKYILRFLDSENVLSPTQISNIYDYANKRDVLKEKHNLAEFLTQVSCDRPEQYAQRMIFFKPCPKAIEAEEQPLRPVKRKGDTSEAFLPLVASPSKRANTAVV